MFGTTKNYYIAEATLSPEETEQRLQIIRAEADEKAKPPEVSHSVNVDLIPYLPVDALRFLNDIIPPEYPPLPPRPIIETVKHEYCNELNNKIYFVCNDFIDEWIELPPVSNRQIEMSRMVVKYFTGNLAADVSRFPYFDGVEKNYLRAVIARIAGSTYVSPTGAFMIKPKQQSDAASSSLEMVKQPDYQSIGIDRLIDLREWVHHSPLIYDHGAVTPFVEENPTAAVDDKKEEVKAVDDKKGKDPPSKGKQLPPKPAPKGKDPPAKKGALDPGKGKPEKPVAAEVKAKIPSGICIFKPCSDDVYLSDLQPWTISNTSTVNCLKDIVLLQSNIWCGAFAFSCGSVTESIYKGWGIKNRARHYLPVLEFQKEADDEDLVEMADPTPAEEEVTIIAFTNHLNLNSLSFISFQIWWREHPSGNPTAENINQEPPASK